MSLLVVGLGNPGPEYAWTPHNLGFLVLERLAHLRGALFDLTAVPPSFDGPRDWRAARDARSGALLVEPLGFMNRSGAAVAPLAQWAGSRPDQVLVVYDDLDLPPAALRLRPHGGTGGHRGVESIVTSLGTDRFPRLRVGIGRPRTEAARYVLTPIPAEQRGEYERALAEAAEALAFWLDTGDLERCMSRYHSRWNPPE